MGRKKYEPKSFESRKRKSTFVMIFEDMLCSEAWKDLTRSQMALYLYCKAQMYAGRASEKKGFGEKYEKNNQYFTMSPAKWLKCDGSKGYDIYTNKRTFQKDMESLIEHGFIDCIVIGGGYLEKNLYTYSSRWRSITEQVSFPFRKMLKQLQCEIAMPQKLWRKIKKMMKSTTKSMQTKKYNMVLDDIGRTLESPLYSLSRSEQKMIIEKINCALDRLLIKDINQVKPSLRIIE